MNESERYQSAIMLTLKKALIIFISIYGMCGLCFAKEIYVDANSQNHVANGTKTLPFRTIARALKNVKAGDTVIVHEGVYRESIRIPGGQPDKPVILKAASGERVVLSGAVPVTGWKKHHDNVYVAELDFQPKRLLVGYGSQPIARKPNEGWWTIQDANDVTIHDSLNLTGLDNELVGGQAHIWTKHGNTFYTVPVASLDRSNGVLTVERKNQWMKIAARDRYYFQNHPSLIDLPGEWAVEKHEDMWRVYFQPVNLEDLKAVEAPYEERHVLYIDRAKHIRISGFEVAASALNGIEVYRSEDITIENCIVHNNARTGFLLRDIQQIILRRSISLYNGYGVMLIGVHKGTVEECEIAWSGVDGLIISWKSDDVVISRNYIHHHLLWGHPDNVQLYRDVKNTRLIDNLLFASGQSIMMQETSDGLLKGNMIIGCTANSVIFGHQNARNYRIHNNTIAFNGLSCLGLTSHDYDIRENVFMTGHRMPAYSVRGVQGYTGHRNLFFNASGLTEKTVVASDKGWHRTFAQYKKATGYDRDSVYGDPRFRHAPVSFAALDGKRLDDCTRDRLYLRKGVGVIRVGHIVEVNFDGVPRKVVGLSREAITISPPLDAKPITHGLVCHWGRNSDLSFDLRLTANSPGATLSATGGPVGSTIDFAAYQRGDFNGDGRRDLPNLPPELEPDNRIKPNAAR